MVSIDHVSVKETILILLAKIVAIYIKIFKI